MEASQHLNQENAGPDFRQRLLLAPVWLISILIAYLVLFEFNPQQMQMGSNLDEHPVSGCDTGLERGCASVPVTDAESQREGSVELPDSADEVDNNINNLRVAQEGSSYYQQSIALQPHFTAAERCQLSGSEGYRCLSADTELASGKRANATADDSKLTYRIVGQVLTEGGIGLGDVPIIATLERSARRDESATGDLRFRTITDGTGRYTLEGLPDGSYKIQSGAHGNYQPGRISARAGVQSADLIVARYQARSVEGQVVTETGAPLEGVVVLPNLLGQPSVLTDDEGRFRLEVSVKSDDAGFGVRFQRPGFSEQISRVEPGQSELDLVKMLPVELWTAVNGLVYSETGEPLAGRLIELRPRSAGQKLSTTTSKEGEFSFPVVEAPANYELIVFGGSDHKDYQQLVAASADVAELQITVDSYEFGEVKGQLVNLHGEPVADFELVLRNVGSRKPNVVVTTDNAGNFDIPAVPAGDFIVASQSAPSVLVQGLHLKAGDEMHLPLVLDWGEHEIRGIVVDANDNPVPASRVVLQWAHEADGVRTRSTRRASADTRGQFVFSDLGPGPHTLQIDAPGYRAVNINHDLDRQGYDLTVRLN
jgi:hypothetical protein